MAKKIVKKSPRPARVTAPRGGGDANPMSVPLLEQLVRLMAENGLTHLDLRDGERRIHLGRGGPQQHDGPQHVPPPPPPPHHAPSPPATPAARDAAAATPAGNTVEIKSPMVGTYYASPSPEAKVFVNVGDKVGPDTDVCIIEAMKVFNNIKAEVSGTVEKVLVENGTAVEYGQPLFLVRPQ